MLSLSFQTCMHVYVPHLYEKKNTKLQKINKTKIGLVIVLDIYYSFRYKLLINKMHREKLKRQVIWNVRSIYYFTVLSIYYEYI
jgi:hypothetical protein